jgi:hypothetical protein
VDVVNKYFEVPFTWDNRKALLENLPNTKQIYFAIFCAEQVFHLIEPKDKEICFKAIEAAKGFIEDKVTKEECRAASAAAYAAYAYSAAYAAYAAYAASAAAYAAYAAAYAAANAAYAAAYAAANAANAANAAYAASAAASAAADFDKEFIRQEQMLYLRELIILGFTEEDRDCWLLVTSL